MACLLTLARGQLVDFSSFARLMLLVPLGACAYFMIMAVISRGSVVDLVSIAAHTIKRA
jgi:hypothetical protein